jgi:hypothetical protein
MAANDELYNQLAFYTLAHSDPSFIHQLVVDAYTAQTANETTKPIAVVFALIGLYLHLEKGYKGKQVQRAHMQLANRSKTWPKLTLPTRRGSISVDDVLACDPGPSRDAMIERWCTSVWESFRDLRPIIAATAEKYLGID